MKRRRLGRTVFALSMLPQRGTCAQPAPMGQGGLKLIAKLFCFLDNQPVSGIPLLVYSDAADIIAVGAEFPTLHIKLGDTGLIAHGFAGFVPSTTEARAAKATDPEIVIFTRDLGCGDAGVIFDPNFQMFVAER